VMRRETLLTACAWTVHAYTASGAVAGIIALDFIAHGDFRPAFVLMGITLFIDSTDGALARTVKVRERISFFDGALLDNVVDYFTYVAVPVLLMLRSGIVSANAVGLAVASLIMLASAYGFCRTDAKTEDHYFRGFPSYWNVAAFYLYCLSWPEPANEALLVVLAVMVFTPIKFIYPSRTQRLRWLTLLLGAVWGGTTAAMLPHIPSYHPFLMYTSLAFIVYYFAMSLFLYLWPENAAPHHIRLSA
jgi:phosphatidylcholine synthase